MRDPDLDAIRGRCPEVPIIVPEQDRAVLLAEVDRLRTGIRSIVNVIGPEPCSCQGQQIEVAYALQIADALLNPTEGDRDEPQR